VTRPTVSLSLDWIEGMSFRNSAGSPPMALASGVPDVSSPPQALAYAVMACMAMDVVHVIEKGRHRLDALQVAFHGERAATHPRRFVTMRLHFELTGKVTDKAVTRAIDLSRDKYCSVWNTVNQDVELTTTFTVRAPTSNP
jgi:putative redox protein